MNIIDPQHPILTQEYAIYTPPMHNMITTIGNWIDQRISGGYIFGPSRYGKSRAVKWFLKQELEQRFNTLMPLIIWVRRDSIMTESEFWNQLLKASNYELLDLCKPRSKVVARELFEERVKTIASYTLSNYVILMIDEAHEVTLREWKWLLGLQNSLDFEGIRLSVFSIASHNILFQPNYLARTGNPHITARFFSSDFKFNGIKRIEELYYILQGYEEDSEWPESSNTTYLQYFAPDLFSMGERLSNHTETIWSAFEDLFPLDLTMKTRHKTDMEIPMQHIALTVEKVLRSLINKNDCNFMKNKDFWLREIAETGFSKHIKMVFGP